MIGFRQWRALSGLGAAALLWLAAAAAPAAPVLGTGEADPVSGIGDAATGDGDGGVAGTPRTAVRTLDRSLMPGTSTGNKNLDLLLELQAQPRAAGPPAPARSAAADESAPARARAAKRQAPRLLRDDLDPALRDGTVGPNASLQRFEGLGTLQGDARAEPPVQRREWRGQFGGDRGELARDVGPSGGGYRDDSALLDLPRDALQFLRDNRLWVLGAVGALVALGAAAKAYSRRI